MLDEPFASLDPPSREGLLEDIAHTLRETGATTVFATHDRVEAQRIADRVAVLDGARLRQVGPAQEVMRRPADAFVAAFGGVENLLPVRVAWAGKNGGPGAVLAWSGSPGAGCAPGARALAVGGVAAGLGEGAPGLLCVRPEDVVVAAAGDDCGVASGNQMEGTIAAMVPQGPLLRMTIDCGVRVTAGGGRA